MQSSISGPVSSRVGGLLNGYIRPHGRALLAAGVLSLAAGASGLALPVVARTLVGDLGHRRGVTVVLLLMAGLVLVDGVLGSLGSYVLRRTAETVVLTARIRLSDRLLGLAISSVDQTQPGDLMSRVTADTTLLRDVTTDALVGAVTGLLTLLATLIMMGLLDFVLLAATLAVFILTSLVFGLVLPRIRRAAREAQESVGAMGAALERTLGAFRTIKAYGAEQREGQRIRAAARQAWHADLRAAKFQAVAGNAAGLSVQVAFLAVLAEGGARVASGAISIGTLVAFLMYVFYLMPPIQQLVGAMSSYQVGAAAMDRISETERLPTEPISASAALPAGVGPAAVRFEDVWFRYRPELPDVHHGVSFAVPPAGMTALVGPSGAGKSTVFSLIERFYETCSGRILVDGKDVSEWPIAGLRATIGYVEQDTPVLSGSLRENLLLGDFRANEGDLADVLRITRLDGLVGRLPAGLDTLVGHRGTMLSGGERQRVAIARALLRRPRLLLLDEATSQLDAINEASLRDTIAEAARTTTVLVVAHRLSTVTMADRIIVMNAGVVQAVGTHAELVAGDPLYAELAATQFLATVG